MMQDYEKHLVTPIRSDRKPLQELIPVSQPLRVLIDPSDICNFKCKFCFQSRINWSRGTIMSVQVFHKIVEQLKDFDSPINVVHLYGFGEPLLNKNIAEFVQILKSSGVAREIAITSNGSMLTHDLSLKLIDAGLSRLSISLNGLSDDDFFRIAHTKISFSRVYDEIKFFYQNKRQCHLHVKINGDDFSEQDKEEFVRLFEDITNTLNIDNVVNVWPGMKITDKEKTMYNTSMGNKRVCPQMFYELIIHSDGSISPCCADYLYHRENLGNIHDTTLKAVWNGQRLNSMRVAALEGKMIPYSACNECTYPDCASSVNITPYREEILEKIRVLFGER